MYSNHSSSDCCIRIVSQKWTASALEVSAMGRKNIADVFRIVADSVDEVQKKEEKWIVMFDVHDELVNLYNDTLASL